MRISLLPIIAASLLCWLAPLLKAADSGPTLPEGAPVLTLTFSTDLNKADVGVAISKALTAGNWENLSWDGDVTTATILFRSTNIKVFAVAGSSEVKLYSTFTVEEGYSEEKGLENMQRYLEKLESAIAKELKLRIRRGAGKDRTDLAI